ncbi:DUF4395 domain-containing protein [Deinococcus psychrotolerans]|uniref:DUF4395 domain-containing protein n=1 Tax=Deinococcus psychrotolerans TaxID=2489213 RepID=A0A3G8YBY8_9DEIO|nr:DUF4395 domain-containing protein [Deinococcus psychrotolerans]
MIPGVQTDLSALKFNQLSVVGLTAAALLFRQPWLIAALGAAMLAGAVWPKRSPMKAAYLAASPLLGLKPNLVGESPEAHHFAQGVGGAFLLASALALLSGLTGLGVVLGFVVIGLVLLNLTKSVCVGCWMYFQYKMLRYRLTAKA